MTNSMMKGRRSSMDIVNEVLAVCDAGAVNKTAIMYRSNLSYEQLKRYLGLLAAKGLIEMDDEGQYQTTSHGQKTLKKVSRAMRTMRELQQELDVVDPGTNPTAKTSTARGD